MALRSSLSDMFADVETTQERGDRLEALKAALDASIARHDLGVDTFRPAPRNGDWQGETIGIIRGGGRAARAQSERIEQIASVAKSLSDGQRAEVESALAELREMQAEAGVSKDITVSTPGNLHPYDLEEPAKQLVPRWRLLGTEIPRTKGVGTSREVRRILGYTNSGMGGVADMAPFFNSESDTGAPLFGQVPLRRGQKIQYAMDIFQTPYVEMSVSDEVTWKAQFANLGYQNSRGLSQLALLWGHLLGEEKAALYARGSGSGFAGAVAAPVQAAAATATTGGSLPTATQYFAKITARAGYGESVVSNEINITTGAGSTNTVTWNVGTEPTGALGYNLYVGTSTGTEKFITSFVGNSFVMTTPPAGSVSPPGADTSANPNAYDGFLTTLTDPQVSGYVARQNGPLYVSGQSNNAGDAPFQNMWASLFSSVYADPDELWVTASIRRELVDFIRTANGTAAAYRIQLREADNGMVIGGQVSGIMNESSPTDKIVDTRVHPYMPAGCAFTRTTHLDLPNSGISDTSQFVEVQPYMSVEWSPIQFTYDTSTYWFGTLVHYAPKWNGAVLGIQ